MTKINNVNSNEIQQFNLIDFSKNYMIILLGFFILLLPTLYDLVTSLWQLDDQAHGPIIFAVVIWLFWQKKDELAKLNTHPNIFASFLLLIPTLLIYITGRSQGVLIFEIGSFIPLVMSILLLNKGWGALQITWFALLFMVFLIPIPGPIVDLLTSVLKGQISHIAEYILYNMGYPVARSGVLITIGQYQLLVADACSGLNSMFSLLAVGSLYIYITNHTNRLRSAILVLAIIPMAFLANVIRVIILILVTYHLGDAAGQGFIHNFAGMILFSFALAGTFVLDIALGLFMKDKVDIS